MKVTIFSQVSIDGKVDFRILLDELEKCGMRHLMVKAAGKSTGNCSTTTWSMRSS
ncbi:MAG: hypothetical protein QOE58_657 [Actinomycetota bacterium]|jgi:hypothetical protein|nr:hypothetical protein [Actinomycetota bacterium]